MSLFPRTVQTFVMVLIASSATSFLTSRIALVTAGMISGRISATSVDARSTISVNICRATTRDWYFGFGDCKYSRRIGRRAVVSACVGNAVNNASRALLTSLLISVFGSAIRSRQSVVCCSNIASYPLGKSVNNVRNPQTPLSFNFFCFLFRQLFVILSMTFLKAPDCGPWVLHSSASAFAVASTSDHFSTVYSWLRRSTPGMFEGASVEEGNRMKSQRQDDEKGL